MTEKDLIAAARTLGAALKDTDLSLATAESCTGGWVAKVMTDIEGSSAWFDRGFVTYTNESKQEMLGVSAKTLSIHGAVSEATVEEMAQGALRHSHADLSLAISGIAGPGGGTADKPVGTVYFAWASRDGWMTAENKIFKGDRDIIRMQAVLTALQGIQDKIAG